MLIEALRTPRDDDERTVPCVRFDVFKFPDRSLRRSFIKRMRAELKGDYTDEDLRFERTWTRFVPPKADLGYLIVSFVVVLLIVATIGLAIAAFAAALSVGSFETAFSSIVNTYVLATLVAASIMGALFTATARRLAVDYKQAAPSAEDEFERLFRDVLDDVAAQKVVVFVDELDRCPADTVVATLDALRTFFDSTKCIFVVAADQQVLEYALTERLRQATPADATNPYYSVGSAFLDKVFHYHISLPPLRTARLEGFAREQIERREGVWKEIDDKRYLLSVLIPSHVTSPRRVKVLLNSFALSYRLLRRRGGITDLDARMPELAKLVCLRSEFPLFAADLHADPELPELILRAAADLELMGVEPDRALRARAYVDGVLPAAQILTSEDDSGAGGESSRQAIVKQHLHQLIQYLRETETIAGPDRDLIHAQGLDTKLPHDIAEELARHARRGSLAELDDMLFKIRLEIFPGLEGDFKAERAALGVLADMVRRRQPQAKRNAVSALLRAVGTISWPDEVLDQETARELASALALEVSRAGSEEGEWYPLFRIGLVAQRDLLIDRVLTDPDGRADWEVAYAALADAAPLIAKWPAEMGQLWALQLEKGDDVAWDCVIGSQSGSPAESDGLETEAALALIRHATEPAKERAGLHLVEPSLEAGIRRLVGAGRRLEAEAAAALLFVVEHERNPSCLLNEDLMARTVDVLDGLETSAAVTVLDLLEDCDPSSWVDVLRRLKLGDVDPGFWFGSSLKRRLVLWDAPPAEDTGPPRALVEIAEHLPRRVRDRMAETVISRIAGPPPFVRDPLINARRELDLLRALARDESWSSDPKVLSYFCAALRQGLEGSVSDAQAASANVERVVRALAAATDGLLFEDELRTGLESSTWLTEPVRTRILELAETRSTSA
jgi:hypothetical protein